MFHIDILFLSGKSVETSKSRDPDCLKRLSTEQSELLRDVLKEHDDTEGRKYVISIIKKTEAHKTKLMLIIDVN